MNFYKLWYYKHRTVISGLFATLIMFIFLIIIMDYIIMPLYTMQGKEEELPDVTEKSFEEAKNILEKRNFRIIVDQIKYDATYPESTVVFQNPMPFFKVKRGRRIYVTLSAGERKVQVPRVIGTSERDAAFILKQSGLSMGEVFYEYSNYYPKGVVCDQVIAEGTEVTEKSLVDITVSIGSVPAKFVVPDIVGKSLEEARKILWKSGLQVGVISYKVQKKLIPDTVIDQSLEPGVEVDQGRPINLVLSKLEEDLWEEY